MTEEKEPYYKILEFLNYENSLGHISDSDLLQFKTMIRDNKYVATYIRALKEKMGEIKTRDDLVKLQEIARNSKSFNSEIDSTIEHLFDAYSFSTIETDPIKLAIKLVNEALDRQGKICDFRDSVLPYTKIGRCENEEHYEIVYDSYQGNVDVTDILTEKELEEFEAIKEKEGEMEAYFKFQDKLNPSNQLLSLLLYSDDDTHKFNDTHGCYACQACADHAAENSECEVSCDMD